MKRVLMVTLAALLLVGCSLFGSLEQSIIGTWSDDSDPGFTITFAKGGEFSTSDGDSGTWKIVEETLTVTFDSGGSSALTILSIDKKTMILSNGLLQFSYTRL